MLFTRAALAVCAPTALCVLTTMTALTRAETMNDRLVVYISLGGDNQIAVYSFDPKDGTLADRRTVDAGGAPGSLGLNARGDRLYAAVRDKRSIGTFRVEPRTGSLAPLGLLNVDLNAAYVKPDRSDKNLMIACYADHRAATYRLNADGLPQLPAVTVAEETKNPHSIQTDPANRIAYVPNTGADKISIYRFDAESGKLSPADPPYITTDAKTGPRHFCFHPMLRTAYFVNEHSSNVGVFDRDESSGKLTPRETLSTLPSDFSGDNTCADVELTPDGRFLYCSNRGHDSLAGFAVDPRTGDLRAIGHFSTEATPREFNIDPSGGWLLAAGQSSGRMAVYKIDQNSGALERVATHELGRSPAWVVIARPNEK